MKSGRKRSLRQGFTLVETLVVVAIMVILLGVSAVGVAYYSRWLKIVELDNAAREIYLAAENRAVLLSGSGRLENLVKKGLSVEVAPESDADGEPDSDYYYISTGSELVEALLPSGTVDPTLMKGSFYIVYERKSGSVTDVFYAEKEPDGGGNFQKFYGVVRNSSRSVRMYMDPMVGYYGGGAAENARADALNTPNVTIRNGEELTAEITYVVLPSMAAKGKTELTVTLTYGGYVVDIPLEWEDFSSEEGYGRVRFSHTIVLDSLDGPHFKDIFKGKEGAPSSFGGEFTVTAELTAEGGTPSKGSDTNNSLFAKDSSEETACIANLRHLQNLNKDTSEVADNKTGAEQIADIDCAAYLGSDYVFTPIQNRNLTSYDGGGFELRGFHAEGANAGLFRDVEGTPEQLWEFKNIRMVNAKVEGTGPVGALVGSAQYAMFKNIRMASTEAKGTGNVGALVGSAENATFDSIYMVNTEAEGTGNVGALAGSAENATFGNEIRIVNAKVKGTNSAGALVGSATNAKFSDCWVYWEREAGSASLRGVLGDNENGYNYQIIGDNAGGLVGQMNGGGIEKCLAATLVKGEAATAGGLAGQAAGAVEITTSYADCYLKGNTVGGLAGKAGSLTLTNCYAAGFIDIQPDGSAAGLCAGGTVTGESVYTVVRCFSTEADPNAEANWDWKPLAPNMSGENYYYLSAAGGEHAKTYPQMADSDFVGVLGSDVFSGKSQSDSKPYNLRTDLALRGRVYDFPGLAHLPHYGDWNTQFVEASLVYYEQYAGNQYGFYGGGVDVLQNAQPVKDGYAIAVLEKDITDGKLAVKINGKPYEYDTDAAEDGKRLHPVMKGAGEEQVTYYLAFLPDELVNTEHAEEKFYQSLTFSVSDGGEKRYYYCPHFANIPIEADAEADEETEINSLYEDLRKDFVSVRTPRHLYMLSKFSEYYGGGYTFRQELDLDYAAYTGYDLFLDGFTQSPIGNFSRVDNPFNGVYDGGYHTIKNLAFKPQTGTAQAYAGLFGYSSGTLRDIVFYMDTEKQKTVSLGSYEELYIGGLVGGNAGRIVNCAVAGVGLTGRAYTATVYVGGLVGLNRGDITDCGAECAALGADTSNFAHAYVGGLVGRNQSSGIISTSYAVGMGSAEADDTSDARVCGFVGYNQGQIRNSYAATNLVSSGTGVEAYGFCGVTEGTQSDTFFLNIGNFTYRDVSYNASYTSEGATGLRYEKLTDQENPPVPGMSFVEGEGKFPYPTALRDAGERPVYYGDQWPEKMNLGIMGVYYWEKLEIQGETTYHASMLAVDSDKHTVSKETTLSNAHSDSGKVTDYGYGYYYTDPEGGPVTVGLTADRICYSQNGNEGSLFSTKNATEEDGVNEAFATLMPGYVFHSYRSFEAERGGLYPVMSAVDGSPTPNGEFTLTQKVGGTEMKFRFGANPHFADALSIVELPKNWELEGGASTDAPGSTVVNPYQVRAVSQLQNINWNINNRNTGTVIKGTENNEQFPYLSYSGATGKYYWRQSHDLNGNGSTQTPIAEYYDATGGSAGTLSGWFGGTYDGDNYVIENVNVQGQFSSCTGLFGIVYNGILKNIILYSSDGNGTVVSGHNTGTTSRWYAIGALAAVAASDSDSALQNCAVAGYKIIADTYVYSANAGDAWGGVEIGGLVGISNMALENCTASTNIHVPGTARSGADNMRIGGLVGAGLKTITNCYVGGQITIDPLTSVKGYPDYTAVGIYIGGIVGGSYFKPLDPQGGVRIGPTDDNKTDNALTNCYSYVILPTRDANNNISGLYVLGGTGEINPIGTNDNKANHGICTITNCYYLDTVEPQNTSDIKTDVNSDGVTALTYGQLANKDLVNGKRIYDLLKAFSPVTSETDGFSVSGKYSYSSAPNLQGMNYPFPTILTRENGMYHVHYGDWPLSGIKRESGGAPIELDLFTKEKDEENLAAHTETLTTEGVGAGGTWKVESEDEAVARAGITEDGELTVTGMGTGVTTLTVTYTTVGGVSYTLPLSVNVTAVLELRADNPVGLYTNDSVGVKLTACNKKNEELKLEELELRVKAAVEVHEGAGLEKAEIDDDLTLALTTGSEEGGATVSINYTYTYRGVNYTGMGAISFSVTEPVIETNEDGTGHQVFFKDGKITGAKVTSENLEEDKLSIDETGHTVTVDMEGVPPETEVTVEVTLTMDGRVHVVTVTIVAEGQDDGSQGETSGERTETAMVQSEGPAVQSDEIPIEEEAETVEAPDEEADEASDEEQVNVQSAEPAEELTEGPGGTVGEEVEAVGGDQTE